MSTDPAIAAPESEATKACIACHEQIWAGATVCKYCGSSQSSEPRLSSKKILAWIGSAGAVLGVITAVIHLYGPARDQFADSAETKAAMSHARAEYDAADYPGAFEAYSDILKAHPRNKAAAEAKLQTAMARVRNYSVVGASDDRSVTTKAATELTGIIRLLEPAAAEANGPRASDLTAHLGWAHYLNFRIGENEVSENTELYLRKACVLDPVNVYANAMLGNWLLQTHAGSLKEAVAHLKTAIEHSTIENKAWARQYQLAGLVNDTYPGVHGELARIANEMRTSGEALTVGLKHDILAIFAPAVTRLPELDEALSAAPMDEMWATYQWLADGGDNSDAEWKEVKAKFNLARMEELAGKTKDALLTYQDIERHSILTRTGLAQPTREALKRLGSDNR